MRGAARLRARGHAGVWAALGALIAVEALGEILSPRGAGVDSLFHDWLHDAGVVIATLLCVARVIAIRRHRAAWAAIAGALVCFAAGEVLWSILYGDGPSPADPNPTDILYLAYYPFAAAGLVALTRHRVSRFEFHRWVDGIAIMLIVATLGVAFVLEPVAAKPSQGTLADVVNFAYPLADVLLVGAVLGVFALVDWRPGRSWGWLGLGLALMAIADTVSTVGRLQGPYHFARYDFLWTLGTAAIAYAAWSSPPQRTPPARSAGWRAIALPLVAQACAAAIQVYAFFHEVPRSERLLTVAVLLLGMAQIYASRDRDGAATVDEAEPVIQPRSPPASAAPASAAPVTPVTPVTAGLVEPRAGPAPPDGSPM